MSKTGDRGQEHGDRNQETGVGGQEPGGSDSSPALPPGFVVVDSPREFRDPAALVVRVPRGIRSKEKLFAIFADKLHFPRYFGWNWDALEELLRDLSWLPADKPIAIVHEDLPFGAGGVNRPLYLDILRDVATHWNITQPGRLLVVLPN